MVKDIQQKGMSMVLPSVPSKTNSNAVPYLNI